MDFGSLFIIREHKRRNAKLVKAYICIFVCFATKAIYIELVADLTSESFIDTLKRFMARRDKVCYMYSDNRTNFVGASRELNELHELFKKQQIQRKLSLVNRISDRMAKHTSECASFRWYLGGCN